MSDEAGTIEGAEGTEVVEAGAAEAGEAGKTAKEKYDELLASDPELKAEDSRRIAKAVETARKKDEADAKSKKAEADRLAAMESEEREAERVAKLAEAEAKYGRAAEALRATLDKDLEALPEGATDFLDLDADPLALRDQMADEKFLKRVERLREIEDAKPTGTGGSDLGRSANGTPPTAPAAANGPVSVSTLKTTEDVQKAVRAEVARMSG